jgi:hypothetical protein
MAKCGHVGSKSAVWCGWCVCLGMIAVSGCGQGGLPRHPVEGVVRVDGQAAERVVIQFQHVDEKLKNDDRFPVALSDAEGRFVLGQQAKAAGAVAGQYRVTFNWLTTDGLDATDRLQGKYADVETTTFQVTVPLAEPLAFDLTRGK